MKEEKGGKGMEQQGKDTVANFLYAGKWYCVSINNRGV